jgi:hypothetical protein
MRQPAQQFLAAVVLHDGLADHRAELRHARGEPWRHPAAVQRQIGAARPSRHVS